MENSLQTVTSGFNTIMDIAGDILLQIFSTNKQSKIVKDERNTAKYITDPDTKSPNQEFVRHYAMYA